MEKKKATVGRRMVSLPADLHERMMKHPEVNWSGVAATAFQQKLGELAIQKKEKAMDDVIERLRASKMNHANDLTVEGINAGKDWAKNTAEFAELRNLNNWWSRMDEYDRDCVFHVQDSAYGAEHIVAEIAAGGENLDRESVNDFWDFAIGCDDDRRYESDFLKGFIEGALDIFREVEAKL